MTDQAPKLPIKQSPTNAKGAQRNDVRRFAGEKVLIGSRLEMALQLQLCESRTEQRRDRSTTWEEKVSFKVGPIIVLAGTAWPVGEIPDGMERPEMSSGAALTLVDREFWEAWREQFADFPAYKNGLIFEAKDRASFRDVAREHKDIASGFSPIQHQKNAQGEDMLVDPRVPRKVSRREHLAQQQAQQAAESAAAE